MVGSSPHLWQDHRGQVSATWDPGSSTPTQPPAAQSFSSVQQEWLLPLPQSPVGHHQPTQRVGEAQRGSWLVSGEPLPSPWPTHRPNGPITAAPLRA